jgi:hypothetical protein
VNIEIDFDVFKAITMRRASEAVTPNDVLREVFKLPPSENAPPSSAHTAPPAPEAPQSPTPIANNRSVGGSGDWVTKGVRFPQGTEFRAKHKGVTHYARVGGGSLVLNGKWFESPSAAAVSITNNSVNGWIFWECRLPGESSWKLMSSLRRD